MAYTTINKSTDNFNTKLFTGNGSTQSITGVGFQPDWVWFKNRSSTQNHRLFDAVRGAGKNLVSNATSAEINAGTGTDGQLRTFDSDGFSVGSDGSVNNNGENIVAWNWKANGQGSSNTDGSINTTYTSANTTAGFSISTYTGTGSAATIGHGLGVKPSMIIVKNLSSSSYGWYIYHKSIAATHEILLNSNAAKDTTSQWNDTEPTSSVFSVGTAAATNGSGNNLVAYCFAEKTGYSKFGSYTGNGNADGTFVYTGFKPAWLLVKQTTGASQNWYLWDNKRDSFNLADTPLKPDESLAESGIGAYNIDMLSNGFKFRGTETQINASGETYIYMAFGQSLVGSNNVPCTAR